MKTYTYIFISFLTAAPIFAQEGLESATQRSIAETRDVAAKAFTTFQTSGQANVKVMGLASVGELEEASLGEPIPVLMVELESLRSYQANADPNKLLKPIDKVVYPIRAQGDVRSSLVVEKTTEGWEVTSIGAPNFARLLTSARDQKAKTDNDAPAAFFLVQVPALNAFFIGYHEHDRLMLNSLTDNPGLKLRAGVSLPAEQVFLNLVPAANAYNGLPM